MHTDCGEHELALTPSVWASTLDEAKRLSRTPADSMLREAMELDVQAQALEAEHRFHRRAALASGKALDPQLVAAYRVAAEHLAIRVRLARRLALSRRNARISGRTVGGKRLRHRATRGRRARAPTRSAGGSEPHRASRGRL